MLRENLIEVAKTYQESIKGYDELKERVITYLKTYLHYDLVNIGALIVSYDPSYEQTYQEKLKKAKIGRIVKWSIIGGILLAIIIAIIGAAV